MTRRLLSLASLLALAVCVLVLPSRVSFAGSEDQNAKELIAIDNDWSNAAVARNVDSVVSFYAEDGAAYPPNAPIAAGRAAVRKVWAGAFSDPTYQVSWKTTAAGVVKNTGWTVGTFQDSSKGSDGKTVVGKGKYVAVWRKGADGKWKAVHDIWNYDSK